MKFILLLTLFDHANSYVSSCGGGSHYYQKLCCEKDRSFRHNGILADSGTTSAIGKRFEGYLKAFDTANYSSLETFFTDELYTGSSTIAGGNRGAVTYSMTIGKLYELRHRRPLVEHDFSHSIIDRLHVYAWDAAVCSVYAEVTRVNKQGVAFQQDSGWYLYVLDVDKTWKIAATGGPQDNAAEAERVCSVFKDTCCADPHATVDTIVWTGEYHGDPVVSGVKHFLNKWFTAYSKGPGTFAEAIPRMFTDPAWSYGNRIGQGGWPQFDAWNATYNWQSSSANYSFSVIDQVDVFKWGQCCAFVFMRYTRYNKNFEIIPSGTLWYFMVPAEHGGGLETMKTFAQGTGLASNDVISDFTTKTGPAPNCSSSCDFSVGADLSCSDIKTQYISQGCCGAPEKKFILPRP